MTQLCLHTAPLACKAPWRSSRPTHALGGSAVGGGRTAVACPRSGGRRCLKVIAFKGGEEAERPATKGQQSAAVTFKVLHHVKFGEAVKLVGGLPEMGEWDVARAPAMEWGEGDQWVLRLQLPPGQHECKVVVVRGEAAVGWEPGPNRMVEIPTSPTGSGGSFNIVCEWGVTNPSVLPAEELSEGRTAVAAAPTAAPPLPTSSGTDFDEPRLHPEDLTAEPYASAGDEEEKPTGAVGKMTVGKMTIEGQQPSAGDVRPEAQQDASAPSSKSTDPSATDEEPTALEPPHGGSSAPGASSGDVPAAPVAGTTSVPSPNDPHAAVPMAPGDYPSQTPVGEGGDSELHGEPAGSLKPSTEAAVKKDLQQSALTGSKQASKNGNEDEDDYDSGGSAAGRGGGGKPSGPRGGSGGGSPPTGMGMRLSATAAGLVALPVVGWSEWVLKTTGCGLPPGPGGVLGAAEGVSYLVVGGVLLWSLARKLSPDSGVSTAPAGVLRTVEGGSWLAAASGLAVLAMQWQTYGYIPSALPDANCYGEAAASRGFLTPQAPPQAPGAAAGGVGALRAPPVLAAADGMQAGQALGGALRLDALTALPMPQANLLLPLEAALSQSGGIMGGAEAAAAAAAAAAAGQPPPAVAAALELLQQRAVQAQQMATVLGSRLAALASGSLEAPAPQVAAPIAATAEDMPATVAPQPFSFQPPRHAVRAALHNSLAAMAEHKKVRAVFEPVPLPAVARQAAERAAAAAADAAAAAGAAAESAADAAGREQRLAAVFGERLLVGMQERASQLQGRLVAVLPADLLRLVPDAAQPAAAAADPAALVPAPKPGAASPKPISPSKAVPKPPPLKPAPSPTPNATTKPVANRGTLPASAMFGAALSDLREGFVELWHSAQEFDPRQVAHFVEERVVGQAPPAASGSQPPAGSPASRAVKN